MESSIKESSALAERATEPAPERPIKRRVSSPRAVLAVAVLGTFMAFVDATIVNIAVPDIAERILGTSLSSVSWVLNAYNIVFAAFLVGGGQLADLLGAGACSVRARVFTPARRCAPPLPSSACSSPHGAAGGGLGAARPELLAIVLEPTRRGADACGGALGSGGRTRRRHRPSARRPADHRLDWRLVFLVNVPVGIVALVLAQTRSRREPRAGSPTRCPTCLAPSVLALAIASLVLAIVKGQEWGRDERRRSALRVSLLLGAIRLRSSRHRAPARSTFAAADPRVRAVQRRHRRDGRRLLRLHPLQRPVPDRVWRYSVLQAGLALTPGPFTAMAVAPSASRLVERSGHRVVVVPGALIWAAGMASSPPSARRSAHFLGEWLPGW